MFAKQRSAHSVPAVTIRMALFLLPRAWKIVPQLSKVPKEEKGERPKQMTVEFLDLLFEAQGGSLKPSKRYDLALNV